MEVKSPNSRLDMDQVASVVQNEVVAFGVSPGLSDAEAELAGFVKEGGFGALSTTFCVF